jgi:hypothetical protein
MATICPIRLPCNTSAGLGRTDREQRQQLYGLLYEPTTMAGLLARILPYYVKSEVVIPVLSREETLAQLRERGLPIELLEHLRKAPARLNDDEESDPYHLKDVASQGGEKDDV